MTDTPAPDRPQPTLDAIEKRLALANTGYITSTEKQPDLHNTQEDAIYHLAFTDIPVLLATVRQLQAERDEYKGSHLTLEGYCREHGETPSMTASGRDILRTRLAALEAERDSADKQGVEDAHRCEQRHATIDSLEARLATARHIVQAIHDQTSEAFIRTQAGQALAALTDAGAAKEPEPSEKTLPAPVIFFNNRFVT